MPSYRRQTQSACNLSALCLAGRKLRGGSALHRELQGAKGPWESMEDQRVLGDQPCPARTSGQLLGGARCQLSLLAAAAGRKENLIFIVRLFLISFCFRDPLLRENKVLNEAWASSAHPPQGGRCPEKQGRQMAFIPRPLRVTADSGAWWPLRIPAYYLLFYPWVLE